MVIQHKRHITGVFRQRATQIDKLTLTKQNWTTDQNLMCHQTQRIPKSTCAGLHPPYTSIVFPDSHMDRKTTQNLVLITNE